MNFTLLQDTKGIPEVLHLKDVLDGVEDYRVLEVVVLLIRDKPPIFGMFQRGGEVIIRMLDNVQQTTIKPLIETYIEKGSFTHTDEYNIYNRLKEWGYDHEQVCHSAGEYAKADDRDGFCEVHTNTIEGFWSLLRSWLRPHRGISQENLPLYLSFFEFVHNSRQRGKALLPSLLQLLLCP